MYNIRESQCTFLLICHKISYHISISILTVNILDNKQKKKNRELISYFVTYSSFSRKPTLNLKDI